MDEQTIQKMLAEQKAAQERAQQERDSQLQMLLEKGRPVDTRATAGFLDSMYGTGSMAGAEAAAEAGNRQDDVLQKLMAENCEPQGAQVPASLMRAASASRGAGEKAPPGYRWNERGEQEMVVGGPAWQKEQERLNKAKLRHGVQSKQAQTVVEDLGRGLEVLAGSKFAAGPLVGRSSMIDGTPANLLSNFVESAKSNIGIDMLQQMRDSSPTGGALGQVPFQQQQRLEQMLGSLSLNQPKQVVEENIKRIMNLYNDIIHGEDAGPERFEMSFDKMGRTRSVKNTELPSSTPTKTTSTGRKNPFRSQ